MADVGLVINCIADVHLGNHQVFGGEMTAGINDRCGQIADALLTLHDILVEVVEPLLVAGDLFDVEDPTPQVVGMAQLALPDWSYVLAGNHDVCSSMLKDNALAALESSHVLDVAQLHHVADHASYTGVRVLAIPYEPGPAKAWLPERVASLMASQQKGDPTLLAVHLGVRDERTPWWGKDAEDAVDVKLLADLAARHGIHHVVAGNWHEPRDWSVNGVQIRQIGSFAATGFDDVGRRGRVVRWSSELGFLDDLWIPGPRFHKVSSLEAIAALAGELEDDCTNYVRAEVGEQDADRAREVLLELRRQGVVHRYEVLADRKKARERARRAVTAAVHADTTREAIAAYVREMQLPNGVDAASVTSEVMRLLA